MRGKAKFRRKRLSPCRDHPRVCGEKSESNRTYDARVGSPPRMRGKVRMERSVKSGSGITPAYAGKSPAADAAAEYIRDHPRVCGEKGVKGLSVNSLPGSPPRMRGKDLRDLVKMPFVRITPAYAGKRAGDESALATPGDHPRVCGEKLYEEMERGAGKGSPPRMRGKARRWRWSWKITRITPAYAGKRIRRVKMPTPVRDHPRVCGEKSTVSPVAIVPLFPSVCNKPVVSDGSPAVRDVPLFLPAENAVPASPACNLRSL